MAEDGVSRSAMCAAIVLTHLKGIQRWQDYEDDLSAAEKEIQKLTDQYISKIDQHLVHKEKEIMTV